MTTIIESIDTIRPSRTHVTVDIAGVAWPVYKVQALVVAAAAALIALVPHRLRRGHHVGLGPHPHRPLVGRPAPQLDLIPADEHGSPTLLIPEAEATKERGSQRVRDTPT